MKEIKRKFKFFLTLCLFGLIFLILGLISLNSTVIGFGVIATVISLLKTIEFSKLLKNKELAKEYVTLIHDERYKYINMRAYSSAFWLTLYIEFVAICILSLMDIQIFAAALGCTFSFKLIIYLLFNIYFSKKY